MVSPRIEYAVMPAGNGPGQDRCFTADGLVVVLDGASAYDPSVSADASEYVDTLGTFLTKQIVNRPGIDLRDALADAIRQTVDELALIPGGSPSSTVSIVRWVDETVDILVLGDSPVIVQFADQTRDVVVQHPMDHIASELRRRYKERLAAGSGYDEEHREILRAMQRLEAPLRNTEGGFWIAGATPASAYKGPTVRSYPSDRVHSCVVATDGAAWPELSEKIAAGVGPASILRDMQRWESECDPEGRIRPRSKQHDDKTIAIIYVDRVEGR